MKTKIYHLIYLNSKHPLSRLHCLEPLSLPHSLRFIRRIQSSRQSSAALTFPAPTTVSRTTSTPATSTPSQQSPLAILPLSTVLRSLLISSVSSSPTLLRTCFGILRYLSHSKSALTNVDRNPLLWWMLKKTFYAQFCAGENVKEVKATTAGLRRLGYHGVVLEYALEVLGDGGKSSQSKETTLDVDADQTRKEVEMWRKGMLETVAMTFPGDFVGAKWSGLGSAAFHLLRTNQAATPLMLSAMNEVCSLAASRSVSIMLDAEEAATNPGIERWTQAMQQQYNTAGRAVVYTTIQSYLKSAPTVLFQHLQHAQQHGYTLGIKLVRGAYLASEPPDIVVPSKEASDAQYDALAESLLRRSYNPVLRSQPAQLASPATETEFPDVALCLATHNTTSIRKAQSIRASQAANREKRIQCAYAQLMGMADEVSCAILRDAAMARASQPKTREEAKNEVLGRGTMLVDRKIGGGVDADIPKVYKLVSWGTVAQCLHYLLRRAAENMDAAGRTREGRDAMARELWRRMRRVVSLDF